STRLGDTDSRPAKDGTGHIWRQFEPFPSTAHRPSSGRSSFAGRSSVCHTRQGRLSFWPGLPRWLGLGTDLAVDLPTNSGHSVKSVYSPLEVHSWYENDVLTPRSSSTRPSSL